MILQARTNTNRICITLFVVIMSRQQDKNLQENYTLGPYRAPKVIIWLLDIVCRINAMLMLDVLWLIQRVVCTFSCAVREVVSGFKNE